MDPDLLFIATEIEKAEQRGYERGRRENYDMAIPADLAKNVYEKARTEERERCIKIVKEIEFWARDEKDGGYISRNKLLSKLKEADKDKIK